MFESDISGKILSFSEELRKKNEAKQFAEEIRVKEHEDITAQPVREEMARLNGNKNSLAALSDKLSADYQQAQAGLNTFREAKLVIDEAMFDQGLDANAGKHTITQNPEYAASKAVINYKDGRTPLREGVINLSATRKLVANTVADLAVARGEEPKYLKREAANKFRGKKLPPRPELHQTPLPDEDEKAARDRVGTIRDAINNKRSEAKNKIYIDALENEILNIEGNLIQLNLQTPEGKAAKQAEAKAELSLRAQERLGTYKAPEQFHLVKPEDFELVGPVTDRQFIVDGLIQGYDGVVDSQVTTEINKTEPVGARKHLQGFKSETLASQRLDLDTLQEFPHKAEQALVQVNQVINHRAEVANQLVLRINESTEGKKTADSIIAQYGTSGKNESDRAALFIHHVASSVGLSGYLGVGTDNRDELIYIAKLLGSETTKQAHPSNINDLPNPDYVETLCQNYRNFLDELQARIPESTIASAKQLNDFVQNNKIKDGERVDYAMPGQPYMHIGEATKESILANKDGMAGVRREVEAEIGRIEQAGQQSKEEIALLVNLNAKRLELDQLEKSNPGFWRMRIERANTMANKSTWHEFRRRVASAEIILGKHADKEISVTRFVGTGADSQWHVAITHDCLIKLIPGKNLNDLSGDIKRLEKEKQTLEIEVNDLDRKIAQKTWFKGKLEKEFADKKSEIASKQAEIEETSKDHVEKWEVQNMLFQEVQKPLHDLLSTTNNTGFQSEVGKYIKPQPIVTVGEMIGKIATGAEQAVVAELPYEHDHDFQTYLKINAEAEKISSGYFAIKNSEPKK